MSKTSKIAIIRALSYKDFSIFMLAETFYRSGIWMTSLAFGIMAAHLKGNSTFYVGLVGFCYNLPMLLLSTYTGMIADRFYRLGIIRILLFWFTIPAVIILITLHYAALSYYWVILIAAFMYGIGFSFGNPALLACVQDIVTNPKDVGGALSLFLSGNRIFQFIGYGLGGLLFAHLGPSSIFYYNIAVYIVALALLLLIKTKQAIPQQQRRKPLAEIYEGFAYVKSNISLYIPILFIALNGLLVWPYIFQMPVVNKYYLMGNAADLGIILAIGGIGGALGGLLLAMRKGTLHLTKLTIIATSIIAVSLIALSFCHHAGSAMVSVFFLDAGLSMFMIVTNTFLQHVSTADKRGRVMGLFTLANLGMIPLGSLAYYGALGELIGPMNLFLIAGIIFILATIYYALLLTQIRRNAKNAFVSKGLIDSSSNDDLI